MLPKTDCEVFNSHPYSTEATCYRLDLTTTSASIALPRGMYVFHCESSHPAMCRFGAVPTIPSSGAGAQTGFIIAGDQDSRVFLDSSATLHARTTTATGILWVTKLF